MGHKSRDAGSAFEEAIDNKLAVLQQLGVVSWVQKNGPGWRMAGPNRYIRTEPSGADRAGHLTGGLSFAVEAKSTGADKKGRLEPFVLESRISATQILHLNAVARDGGLALLALQFRPVNQPWGVFVIPWLDAPWQKATVNHHLRPDLLQRWRLGMDDHLFERYLTRDSGGRFVLAGPR